MDGITTTTQIIMIVKRKEKKTYRSSLIKCNGKINFWEGKREKEGNKKSDCASLIKKKWKINLFGFNFKYSNINGNVYSLITK